MESKTSVQNMHSEAPKIKMDYYPVYDIEHTYVSIPRCRWGPRRCIGRRHDRKKNMQKTQVTIERSLSVNRFRCLCGGAVDARPSCRKLLTHNKSSTATSMRPLSSSNAEESPGYVLVINYSVVRDVIRNRRCLRNRS